MKKSINLSLMFIVCLILTSCNRVPADMFPRSVGAFQFKEGSAPYTDEKGYKNFYAKYVSPDSQIIGCTSFDASSEAEAVNDVAESDKRDDTPPTKPILDKNGKQIGVKLLNVRSGSTSTLRWNIGKRAYWCNSEVTEKTFEEFYNNWQGQNSK